MNTITALQNAKNFIIDQQGTIAPLMMSEEEISPEAQDDLSLRAYPIESAERCYEVDYSYPEDCEKSEFSFFEDGRQRTVLIGFLRNVSEAYVALVPVHYFIVSAVILERKNKYLELWREPLLRQGIITQKSLIPDQGVLHQFEDNGLLIVDSHGQGGNYQDLRESALEQGKKMRLAIEDDLITAWRTSSDAANGYLVIDGTLMNFRNEENIKRCVGVSKSFGSRYFTPTLNNKIFEMNEFQRSWTFKFHGSGEDLNMGPRERVSWYLRLRKHIHSDPEFGLIRVEISKEYEQEASVLADRFSKSLLSERLPTSYPYPRWDKHLFSIRECEKYLSSIMPSISTISESMKGSF